jgi:hypothetical protein
VQENRSRRFYDGQQKKDVLLPIVGSKIDGPDQLPGL